MMKLNTGIVFVGSFGYDFASQRFCFNDILFAAKDISALTKKIDRNSCLHVVLSIIIGAVAVFMGYFAYDIFVQELKLAKLDKELKLKQERFQKHLENQGIPLSDELQTKVNCIVCTEVVRDVILLPCLHFELCFFCFERLKSKGTCPSCNRQFTSISHMYTN